GDWAPQIFLDVVGEGAERRDVDTAHARFHSIRFKFSEKRIKNTKKPGQRFPASGWRGQQNRFTVKNGGNAEQLGVSETRKSCEKPISQARMQSCGKSLLLFHKLKSRHPERNASPARTRGIPLRARNTGRWPVRPQRTLSPLSLIQRKAALLPPVQRSVTPLGAQTASLCSNAGLPFRIHREMLVLQMLRDARRLLGFNLLRGGA